MGLMFHFFSGFQYYFEIYVTLEQNLNCLVYREREFWIVNKLNLVLKSEELRQLFISSVREVQGLYTNVYCGALFVLMSWFQLG